MTCLKSILYVVFSFFLTCYTRMPSKYSDFYARHKLWGLGSDMSYRTNQTLINQYLDGCFFNYTFIKHVEAPCDFLVPNNTNMVCGGSLFVSHDDEAIILAFHGTEGNQEWEYQEELYNMTVPFLCGGNVSAYYYNGVYQMWNNKNNSFNDSFYSAKTTYPTYELWVTGYSMGGSMAGMMAPYISCNGYFDKDRIKMISFGENRIGLTAFAENYANLVPYAYRVVHRYDIIVHYTPLSAGYLHHGNEIWYNNDMNSGDPYLECDGIETTNCSNSVSPNLWNSYDHGYFGNSGYCLRF